MDVIDKDMLFLGVDLLLNLKMGHEFLYDIAGYLALQMIFQFLGLNQHRQLIQIKFLPRRYGYILNFWFLTGWGFPCN